jgi:hypothetical protein
MHKYTHTGMVENYNYGTPYRYKVLLRETKLFWVNDKGTKYRKTDGRIAGSDTWSQSFLRLDEVKPLDPAAES